METFDAMTYTGYVYPNETVLPWSVLIVIYPYITGLVAGAFTVSALHKVFNVKALEPVAHFAVLVALCCMCFVPVPLLFHLGQPTRAFNAMITPHWTSAFVAFSYFASFYIILLLVENWFVFRPRIVYLALYGKNWLVRLIFRVLTLGSTDLSEKAMAADEKWIYALAVIGLPAACGLHGYVGFVFGSLKSREWWSSDLMPVIFLLSAIISGTGLLIVLYALACKLRRVPIDMACMKTLANTLMTFLIMALVLEALEFISMVYRGREGIDTIMQFLSGPLKLTYVYLQWGSAAASLVLLSFLLLFRIQGRALVWGLVITSLLVLLEVLMMRWNVVIGGQEISKTGSGLLRYAPPMFGREGLTTGIAILCLPMIALSIMVRIFPPFHDQPHGKPQDKLHGKLHPAE